jgi:uncharacterized protein YeaO (DUF488 family)
MAGVWIEILRVMPVHVKRVYDPPSRSDGLRILVDRLWPRGLKKEDAALERWDRDVAPSNELRKEFGHDHSRWDEFRARYFAELDANPEPVERLAGEVRKGTVTLLFAARDTEKNNAVALAEYLRRRAR